MKKNIIALLVVGCEIVGSGCSVSASQMQDKSTGSIECYLKKSKVEICEIEVLRNEAGFIENITIIKGGKVHQLTFDNKDNLLLDSNKVTPDWKSPFLCYNNLCLRGKEKEPNTQTLTAIPLH